nr:MAG TPA: hypothetical protein [Caudoviricetes sp.]
MGLLGKNSRTFRPVGGHRGGRGFLPDTPVVREVVDEQIRNGAVGFTGGLLDTYFAIAGLPDDTKSRSSQRYRAYKYLELRGWKKQTIAPSCIICHSPVVKADQLVKLTKLALLELKEQKKNAAQDSVQARKVSQAAKRDSANARAKLRDEIIQNAMIYRDPLVAYAHRAAKVCGVVRGYQWP